MWWIVLFLQVMRLESFKRRWIGDSNPKLQTDCSSSFDSTDDESRIRLDDPTLRLNIAESPSPTYEAGDLNFNDFCANKSPLTSNKLSSDVIPVSDKSVWRSSRQYLAQLAIMKSVFTTPHELLYL